MTGTNRAYQRSGGRGGGGIELKLSTTSKPVVAAASTSSSLSSFLKSFVALLLSFFLGVHVGRTGDLKDTFGSLETELYDSNRNKFEPFSGSDGDDNWRTIHVHTGGPGGRIKGIAELAQETTFSQVGQDLNTLKLLENKREGFFVDLASNHPTKLSNTFLLERDYDWTGLCIEPNWQYWVGLASLRKCEVVGAVGGGPTSEEISFRMHPSKRFVGAFAGIVGDDFDNKPNVSIEKNEHIKEMVEETRYTVPLATILEKFGAPETIDYLSLDVEGAEALILNHFPFDQYKFLTMSIERSSKETKGILRDNGYILLETLKYGDEVWKHSSLPGNL